MRDSGVMLEAAMSLSSEAAQTILEAMALVVGSDDEGHDEETATISTVYRSLTGTEHDADRLGRSIATARSTPDELWRGFAARRTGLTLEEKDLVIQAATRVCIADADMQEGELQLLSRIAKTLDVPGGQLRAAMRAAWRASKGA